MNSLHNPGLPVKVDLGCGQVARGFSISALATYMMVPHWDLVFDLGHCPLEAVSLGCVFLTHTHLDHMAGVPLHSSLRAMRRLTPPTLYCPEESQEPLQAFLSSQERLERRPGESGAQSELERAQVVGLVPGDRFLLSPSRTVETFSAHHVLPSLGYTVSEERKSLDPQYRGLSGAEIARLARSGVAVNRTSTVPLLTFIGDSTVRTLEENPGLGASETLVIEVTHLDDVDPEFSLQHGHTHIRHLVELWGRSPESLASPRVVIKHFSMRYSNREIRAAMLTLPEELRARVQVLIPPE